jgi:hypothetical protein
VVAVVASALKSKPSTAALMDMIPDNGTAAELLREKVSGMLRFESYRIGFRFVHESCVSKS